MRLFAAMSACVFNLHVYRNNKDESLTMMCTGRERESCLSQPPIAVECV